MLKKKKLLLHACCAPCASYVIEVLKSNYDLTVFFYNSNIHPEKEYIIRLNEIKKYCEKLDIKFIEAEYNPQKWFEMVKDYKNEKEGGKRCELCFKDRFEKTAEYAQKNKFDIWTSTLSISPHKNAEKLNEIGKKIAEQYNIEYMESNWKKNNGYQISCKISREEGFYRQFYCGCIYSYQEALEREKRKKEKSQ